MLASLDRSSPSSLLPPAFDTAADTADGDAWVKLGPWALSVTVHLALVLIAIFAVWLQSKRIMGTEPPITPTIVTSHQASVLTWRSQHQESHTHSLPKKVICTAPPEPKDTFLSKEPIKRSRIIGIYSGPNAGRVSFDSEGPGSQLQSNDLFSRMTPIGAKRIVYVIDASGSLIDTMPFVLGELKRSIAALGPRQKFSVVFFQHDRVLEIPPLGLKLATPKARAAAIRWLSEGHVVPRDSADPLAGIRRALSYRPQLVFLLSDNITGKGRWEMAQETFLDQVRRANTSARFNTIQFLYEDPLKAIGKGRTLQKLSRATGGVFKFADARELGLE